MPFQPSTRELVSVDNWYQLGKSSPTTTEVLVYTLLVELVVGPDREAFMGAVEAEMTPNTVPQDHTTRVWWAGALGRRCPTTARTLSRLSPRYWQTSQEMGDWTGCCPRPTSINTCRTTGKASCWGLLLLAQSPKVKRERSRRFHRLP